MKYLSKPIFNMIKMTSMLAFVAEQYLSTIYSNLTYRTIKIIVLLYIFIITNIAYLILSLDTLDDTIQINNLLPNFKISNQLFRIKN